ncbi:hypothetical protein J6590_050653 [Homalodisca vitripennis]|nr:hypothetical protein J6590_050653 [Homalodisca vitripennis]
MARSHSCPERRYDKWLRGRPNNLDKCAADRQIASSARSGPQLPSTGPLRLAVRYNIEGRPWLGIPHTCAVVRLHALAPNRSYGK